MDNLVDYVANSTLLWQTHMNSLSAFHFLRPIWLVMLIPLGLACIYWWRFYRRDNTWQLLCDAHLLPHLLIDAGKAEGRWPVALLALSWLLAVLALAGPTWVKLPEPVYRQQAARIIVLDLSKSMDATDITPSRLTRAKFKVQDILKQSREGQTALLVFAAEPYAVAPLSDDSATLAALLPPLSTQLMPTQGSRLDLALLKADELLANTGMRQGEVIVISDGTESLGATEQAAATLRKHGHRVAVLAVGTQTGAPIPSEQGGFLTDEAGNTVIVRLDVEALKRIADVGGGPFQTMTNDDRDIAALLNATPVMPLATRETRQMRTTDRWREEGPWLLFALLPLAALAFRRGWLTAGIVIVILTTPSPSYAFSFDDLWARPDQQGAKALQRGDPAKAAKLFKDSTWQGTAHYRAGNFRDAASAFGHNDNADAHYNRGNALARAGRLKEAVEAYGLAIQKNPTHSDAQFNLDVVNKILQRQKANKENQQSSQDKQNSTQQKKGQSNTEGNESDDKSRGQTPSKNTPGTTKETSEAKRQAQGDPQPKPAQDKSNSARAARTEQDLESSQALEQWLRQIPDDPGGLMRRKFMLEHQRRAGDKEDSNTPW